MAWVGPNDAMGAEVANAQVQPNVISFSVSAPVVTAAAIGIFFADHAGANPKLAVASNGTFTAAAGS